MITASFGCEKPMRDAVQLKGLHTYKALILLSTMQTPARFTNPMT
jgi:hypothetical protein